MGSPCTWQSPKAAFALTCAACLCRCRELLRGGAGTGDAALQSPAAPHHRFSAGPHQGSQGERCPKLAVLTGNVPWSAHAVQPCTSSGLHAYLRHYMIVACDWEAWLLGDILLSILPWRVGCCRHASRMWLMHAMQGFHCFVIVTWV